ncbi:flagellar basal body P-ring formation chaperone FlgA [Ferrimonas lipolytica]|uniref:Flagella basal body P-ring formation protein FlgA n=1 Tax=Ferrimonas lipolytica TaxID=2724191 RepID=A0A6H1UDU5_9GAMM|nr:flagellar basal body P-ring formation chaperone FlgA [Ferrimonas lipolytica]QIZ77255.1 flagellar basal body P-ring formation protein FlgA [Ferrimonas lipolytica]
MKRVIRKAICIVPLLAASATIAAEPKTALTEIEQTAEHYVTSLTNQPQNGEVIVKAKPLDKRLKLAVCKLPLDAEGPDKPSKGRYVTVKVSCPDENGWSVYVPVQSSTYIRAVISIVDLQAESMLDSQNISVALVPASSLRGNYFTQTDELIGARLVRRSSQGQAIKRNNVCQVCKGDVVTIYARSNGFELKTSGEAIANGAVGDTIRVRNNRSQRIIDAKIIAVGKVEVQL